MNLAKLCLAVLLGVLLGMGIMRFTRPFSVKAASGTVYSQEIDRGDQTLQIKGTAVVGFSCTTMQTSRSTHCFVLSQ